MAVAYIYSPLTSHDTIRVLDLHPASDHEASIQLVLREVHIASHDRTVADAVSQYEALSYVWGTKTGTRPVWCDLKELLITPNCESALRHLRRPNETRTLWIDSICINQYSDDERSRQVRIMCQIYENARQVLIWLGEGNSLTPHVFQYLQESARPPGVLSRWFLDQEKRHERRYADLDDKIKEDLLETIQSRYFWRLWTVQEVAASASAIVLRGSSSISWDKFIHGGFCIPAKFLYPQYDPDRKKDPLDVKEMAASHTDYERCRKIWQKPKMDYSRRMRTVASRTILETASAHHCSDPKDKVFALHGFFHRIGVQLPEPDYTMPVEIIYAQAVRAIIQYTASLEVLMMVDVIGKQDNLPLWTLRLPSWVPNLLRSTYIYTEKSLWNASQDSLPSTALLSRGPDLCICLEGVRFGVVTRRGMMSLNLTDVALLARSSPEKLMIRLLSVARNWTHIVQISLASHYPTTGEPLLEALVSTLLHMDPKYEPRRSAIDSAAKVWSRLLYDFERDLQIPVKETRPLVSQVTKCASAPSLRRCTLDENDLMTLLLVELQQLKLDLDVAFKEFMALISLHRLSRRLFVTDGGHFGLGSTGLEVGDAIVLLAGSILPMIVRPRGSRFQLIGSAVVHGVMKGEAWPNSNNALREFEFV